MEGLLNAQEVITLLMGAVAVVSFLVGILAYKTHDNARKFFAYSTFSIGFWVAARTLFQLPDPGPVAELLGYLVFIPPLFIALNLILFSLYLGNNKKVFSPKEKILIFLPWVSLTLFTLMPGNTSSSVSQVDGINVINYGRFFFSVYVPVLAAYLLAIFPILIGRYRKAGYELKIKLRYIIFGALFSISTGIFANLLFPFFGLTDLVWVGPLAAILLVAFVGYALSRRELWDFKLVVTEVIIFVILATLFVDIFLSVDNFEKLVFKVITFSFAGFFGFFLIRGIFQELEARENVQHLLGELEGANTRLRAIDVEKSNFVSIASHQLRTPLTTIKGYASMLIEGSFGPIESPEHKKVIEKIYEASQRLVAMIEDFLDISKIEQGKMDYSFEKMDLRRLLESTIEEVRTTVRDDARIILHADKNDSFVMIGDTLKIRQVINNLLDNAIKYSPHGSSIDLFMKKENAHLLLSIHDRGLGIPKKVLPRLFRKYSRSETTQKLHTEGRGLGLYIAKQIVAAHGGKIWAYSKGENKGSVFNIQFKEYVPSKRVEVNQSLKTVN